MNKNSKKCLVVFGPLRISEDPQSFKGKGPGDPFDLFLISKPGCHALNSNVYSRGCTSSEILGIR